MKLHLLKSLAFAGAVLAANPAMADAFDGPYAGIDGGWIQNRIGTAQTKIGTVTLDRSQDAATVGVFAGYNYKPADKIVLSAEGGFKMSFDDQVTRAGRYTLASIDPEYAFDVGVRAGYLATGNTLLYVRGGYENMRASVRRVDAVAARYSKDSFDGWSVGGGVERAVTQRMSARVEYRYSDLAGSGDRFERHQALVGVAYHF